LSKNRLEAFSDGVLAIVITIMVLELVPPHGTTIDDLRPLAPILLSYILSFANMAIWWNNHHHLFQAVHVVDGRVLWANMLLLFFLSLFPFATAWMGQTAFASQPVALYGGVMLAAAISYFGLVRALIAIQPEGSNLASAIGSDTKGKVSPLLYGISIPIALIAPYVSVVLYIIVAAIWIVPDTRIERTLAH
jgi:TMEM175 potassium channel family protein